ncbi:MAG: shikimate dehydrogenase [bacterium]
MPSAKKLAVIGDPISHSLSPVLQNFLIRHFALPFTYEALHVRLANLPAMIQRLRDGEFHGINVTIPHKQAVLPLLDEIEETAARIGAVNTIAVDNGKLLGYNTDVIGFRRSLEAANISVEGKTVLVLGAGGAARAVVFALLQALAGKIFLCNRSKARVEELMTTLAKYAADGRLQNVPWLNRNSWIAATAPEVIVNTTSVGMHPQIHESPLSNHVFTLNQVAVDLVYNPLQTAFLQAAIAADAKTINGLGMLIHQGVAALELWSKTPLDIRGIYSNLENELRNALK